MFGLERGFVTIDGVERMVIKSIIQYHDKLLSVKERMAPSAARLYRRIIYDEVFGLHSHSEDAKRKKAVGIEEHLLSLTPVLVHELERTYGSNSSTGKFMKEYADSGILTVFGISYIEYMEMTLPDQALMREQAKLTLSQRTNAIESSLDSK